ALDETADPNGLGRCFGFDHIEAEPVPCIHCHRPVLDIAPRVLERPHVLVTDVADPCGLVHEPEHERRIAPGEPANAEPFGLGYLQGRCPAQFVIELTPSLDTLDDAHFAIDCVSAQYAPRFLICRTAVRRDWFRHALELNQNRTLL